MRWHRKSRLKRKNRFRTLDQLTSEFRLRQDANLQCSSDAVLAYAGGDRSPEGVEDLGQCSDASWCSPASTEGEQETNLMRPLAELRLDFRRRLANSSSAIEPNGANEGGAEPGACAAEGGSCSDSWPSSAVNLLSAVEVEPDAAAAAAIARATTVVELRCRRIQSSVSPLLQAMGTQWSLRAAAAIAKRAGVARATSTRAPLTGAAWMLMPSPLRTEATLVQTGATCILQLLCCHPKL